MKKWVKKMTPPISINYSEEIIDFNNYSSHEIPVHSVKEEHSYSRNFNSYYFIYKFILNNILSKYDVLSSCDLLHEDELGNPAIEFYIKYEDYLSFDERNLLNYNILEDIYNFCVASNFVSDFENISIFLVQR